jgi:ATP-dependent DNA helicase DinG
MELTTPRDFGLPHDEWYPNQEAAVAWAVNLEKTAIMEAPTGSGKTGVAAAIASMRKTLAIVRTKFLQENNYEIGYGFTPLYGKANYPCVYSKAKDNAMADDCAFSDEGMNRCPQFGICPYATQRELARNSDKTVLNYAYWFNVYAKWPSPDRVICDEAHQLSDLTLNWAGLTITEDRRQEWDLPSFPIINNQGGKSILSKKASPHSRALAYLQSVRTKLVQIYDIASSHAQTNPEARKTARKVEMFGKKVRATIDAMAISEDGWYLMSGPRVQSNGKWGFVAKPLTARYHFPQYFMRDDWRLLIMSATIGEPNVFASELGIKDFDFLQVPNAWAPEQRPIHALDVPRLGRKSPESAYEKQADSIAKAIKGCDPRWSGIIHTTSIAEAGKIARRLHSRGLEDRVIVSERKPTNQMVMDWHRRLRQVPNSILVTWALWEGYDGTKERINIAAKTPYPYLGDKYEQQRQKFDGKFFLQRTAWTLEQGLGRTRRGQLDDYDTEEEQNGFVAIADGGYKWIRSYLSKSTKEAII